MSIAQNIFEKNPFKLPKKPLLLGLGSVGGRTTSAGRGSAGLELSGKAEAAVVGAAGAARFLASAISRPLNTSGASS